MQLRNTNLRYGGVTKFFHWLVFLLFLNQYIVARAMLNVEGAETAFGYTQGPLYNWHKSIGIILLGIALLRFAWRRTNKLPEWAESLSERQHIFIHWMERLLYFCMFLMPISGYIFVMAGGFGIDFFSSYQFPNPIGKIEWLGELAGEVHKWTGYGLLVLLAAHIGFVFWHQLRTRDGYLKRMLPFTR